MATDTTVSLGTDYGWFSDATGSTYPGPNSYDAYDVITTYDINKETIDSQLEQMRTNGQTTIALPIYPIDGFEGLDLMNSAGGNLNAHDLSNFDELLTEIKSLGFTSVLYRFNFQGASAFPTASAGEIANNSALIANLTNEVFAQAGIPYMVDLTGEGIYAGMSAQAIAYDQTIWTTYVSQFGTSHTVGFSTNHVYNQAGINALEAVYQNVYPAEFAFELYTDHSTPSAFQQITTLNTELTAAGIDRPWVIPETYYDDPVIAGDVAEALSQTGQQVTALYQWQITSPPTQSNVIPPLDISAYKVINGGATDAASIGCAATDLVSVGVQAGLSSPTSTTGRTLTVGGAGCDYQTLSSAVQHSQDGDVIVLNPGTYTDDQVTITDSISIIGASDGGTSLVEDSQGSGPIVTVAGNVDVLLQNLSFSGAANTLSTGAAVLYLEGNLTLENDAFSNNQFGLLATPSNIDDSSNVISIDHSTFINNGLSAAFGENLSVGPVSALTFSNSISEGSSGESELESSAQSTTIDNSLIEDTTSGTASNDVEFPNGGTELIRNTLIEKGSKASTDTGILYEGSGAANGSALEVLQSTFLNDSSGGTLPISNMSTTVALVKQTEFGGIDPSSIAAGPVTIMDSSETETDTAAHDVSLNTSIVAVKGGAGPLTVCAANSYTTTAGGPGGLTYSEVVGASSNLITTSAGSANTLIITGWDRVDSEGTDEISTGVGNVDLLVGGTATVVTGSGTMTMQIAVGGAAVVTDGTGSDQFTVAGTLGLRGTNGTPSITVIQGASVTISGVLRLLNISNLGSVNFDYKNIGGSEHSMTVTGGDTSISQVGQTMDVTTLPQSGTATVHLGKGASAVSSVGADTIYCGSGPSVVSVSNAARVYGGSGKLTVIGTHDVVGAAVYGSNGTITLSGDAGDLTYSGGAQTNTVIETAGGNNLTGGSGRMTVQSSSNERVIGGRGGLVYIAGTNDTANLITTSSLTKNIITLGGADVVRSWGADMIFEGFGSSFVTIFGDAAVYGGSGHGRVVVNGTLSMNAVSSDDVQVNPGGSATVTGGTDENVSEINGFASLSETLSGSPDTATVVGGTAVLTGGNGQPITIGSSSGEAVSMSWGSGPVEITSSGADLIHGGSGDGTITISGSGGVLWGGSGALTVNNIDATAGDTTTIYAGIGNVNYVQAAANLVFIGGAGSAIIDGGSGNLSVSGGSGETSVSGGAGNLLFTAGSGRALLTTGLGAGTFEFGSGLTTLEIDSLSASCLLDFGDGRGGGSDVINGFRPGHDRLELNNGISVTSSYFDVGGGHLVLSDNSEVNVSGIQSASQLFT